ncbi:hypothetical protein AAC387_Pa02g2483 [Persea americana]
MTSVTTPTLALVMVNHGGKPEKFNGIDFKRWQQKMLFYLPTLNLAQFLHQDAPALKEDETNKKVVDADFKNYLKHKHKEMRLECLIVRLRIKEDNRAYEKKTEKTFTEAKSNVVEHRQNPKERKNFGNGLIQGPNDKNKRFKGKCYV